MNTAYKNWLADLKGRIQSAQIKAAVKVNAELILLYWDLGQEVLQKEASANWGDKWLVALSADLQAAFPKMRGFSLTNLKYIRLWVKFYVPVIGQQAVDQLLYTAEEGKVSLQKGGLKKETEKTDGQSDSIGQQAVGQLSGGAQNEESFGQQAVAQMPSLFTSVPWGHHLQIITKCKTVEEAFFYLKETAAHGWSRNVLVMQMESGLYGRQGKAITNFAATLPKAESDLANELLKNPYNFDFLTIGLEAKERDIETALVQQITSFLLELGQGFAYLGKQYKLELEGEAYFLDLLFYHTRLRCYVVIELKACKFETEYAGKLNFYLNVVDDLVCHPGDGPSIGLLRCRSTGGKLKAEYALSGIRKPLGLSEFNLRSGYRRR